ncbi:Septation initiation network scaffold protein cdc11 [Smittium mucronatum]|uniref:Septation initiation network scaffold protein cdc11 n=1 Tax=Smittium mucronatum TaxID=133383 RepID=A0A1R0H9B1_9FUNG|nr:Septation initiation network scaffold protein cdc11 [Smittium mucronatum]
MWKIQERFNKAIGNSSNSTKIKRSNEKKNIFGKNKNPDRNDDPKPQSIPKDFKDGLSFPVNEGNKSSENIVENPSFHPSAAKNNEIFSLKESLARSKLDFLDEISNMSQEKTAIPDNSQEISINSPNQITNISPTEKEIIKSPNLISEDTFLFNPDVSNDSNFNFEGQLSNIFSPLMIERLFNQNNSNQTAISESEDNVKKILWGDDVIGAQSSVLNSYTHNKNEDVDISVMINELNINPSPMQDQNINYTSFEDFDYKVSQDDIIYQSNTSLNSHNTPQSKTSQEKSTPSLQSSKHLSLISEENYPSLHNYSDMNNEKENYTNPKLSIYKESSFSKTEPDFYYAQKIDYNHQSFEPFGNHILQRGTVAGTANPRPGYKNFYNSDTTQKTSANLGSAKDIFSRNPNFDSVNNDSKLISEFLVSKDSHSLDENFFYDSQNIPHISKVTDPDNFPHDSYSKALKRANLPSVKGYQGESHIPSRNQSTSSFLQNPSIINPNEFVPKNNNGSDKSTISNKTSKSQMVLLTPDDFAIPLPDRIGDMVLDKKKKQWINVSKLNSSNISLNLPIIEENKYFPTVRGPVSIETNIGNEKITLKNNKTYSSYGSRNSFNMSRSLAELESRESLVRTDLLKNKSYIKNGLYGSPQNRIATRNLLDVSQNSTKSSNIKNNDSKIFDEAEASKFDEIYLQPSKKKSLLKFTQKDDPKTDVESKNSKRLNLNSNLLPEKIIQSSIKSEIQGNRDGSSKQNNQIIYAAGTEKNSDTLMSRLNSFKNEFNDLTTLSLRSMGIRNLLGLSSRYPDLEVLDVFDNKISSFDGIPSNLISFHAGNNWFSIGSDSLAPKLSKFLPHLEFIDLSENQVSNLDIFSGLLHLRVLILNRNQISNLSTLKNVRRLSSLSVSDNFIKAIDLSHKDLVSLEYLNLSNNRIEIFENIDNFSNLKKLTLESNDIRMWRIQKPLERLTSLSLSGNHKLFRSSDDTFDNAGFCDFFPSLKSLFLDGVHIRSIGKAETLSVKDRYNSIIKTRTNFYTSSNNSLDSLINNKPEYYDNVLTGSASSLHKLKKSSDGVDVPISNNPLSGTLQYLSIKGSAKTRNSETKINFGNMPNLKKLYVSMRKVDLEISDNRLDPLPINGPTGLPRLQFLTALELVGCKISELPSNIGFALPQLEILDVSLNKDLHSLPKSLSKCKKLTILRCQFTAIGCGFHNIEKKNPIMSPQVTQFNRQRYSGDFSTLSKVNFDSKKALHSFEGNLSDSIPLESWLENLVVSLKGLNRLIEFDIRGCPLTRYMYSPLDELSDFIIPKYIPKVRSSGTFQSSINSKNVNNFQIASQVSLDINKNLISSSLSPQNKKLMYSQIESLANCKTSSNNLPNTELEYSHQEAEVISKDGFSALLKFNQSYVEPQKNQAGPSSRYDGVGGQYRIYGYSSDLSIKAAEEWARTDEAFEAWISKIIIGRNLMEYRRFYRSTIINLLPKLKWLDGIECEH